MADYRTIEIKNQDEIFSIEFAFCPPGKFRILNIPKLGVKNAIVEYSQGFWLQTTPVSLGLYKFLFSQKYFDYDYSPEDEVLYPWFGVDFRNCLELVTRLNDLGHISERHFKFDIPTSTEWEHALLCGDDRLWSWGDDESELSKYAWYRENSGNKVHRSKEKKCNKWGLFDMYGNVSEYCYESLLDFNFSYFLNPRKIIPASGNVLPCMGGNYSSSSEECQSFNFIGFENQFLEPTGLRLILRDERAIV